MELHHKLRRDPTWHPSACNICGQMGHQAAQCTVGTINWRAMYGEDTFVLRPSIFQSDTEAREKARKIDFSVLRQKAKEYAEMPKHPMAAPEGAPGAAPPGHVPAVALPPGVALTNGVPPVGVAVPPGAFPSAFPPGPGPFGPGQYGQPGAPAYGLPGVPPYGPLGGARFGPPGGHPYAAPGGPYGAPPQDFARAQGGLGPPGQAQPDGAREPARVPGGAEGALGGASASAPASTSVPPPAVEQPLPEGWAPAQDGQGRTYYWHRDTKEVTWDRPTAGPSGPVPGAATGDGATATAGGDGSTESPDRRAAAASSNGGVGAEPGPTATAAALSPTGEGAGGTAGGDAAIASPDA